MIAQINTSNNTNYSANSTKINQLNENVNSQNSNSHLDTVSTNSSESAGNRGTYNNKTINQSTGDVKKITQTMRDQNSLNNVAINHRSSVSIRDLQLPKEIFNVLPDASLSLDVSTRMDFSGILNKPFFLQNLHWTTTQSFQSFINTGIYIPEEIISANPLLKVPFQSTAKWNGKMCVIAQVLGTPFHQGTIVLYVEPAFIPKIPYASINDAMAAPHVLLSANQSTAACLEVPFFCSSNVGECFTTSSDYYSWSNRNVAVVRGMVLNPLLAPNTGSTEITISIHFMFLEANFYIPNVQPSYGTPPFVTEATIVDRFINKALPAVKDFIGDGIDIGVKTLRYMTGLDYPTEPIPNHLMRPLPITPLNSTQGIYRADRFTPFTEYIYKNDPHTFGTDQDEMDIMYMLKKPGYLNTFVIDTADAEGTLLFSCPIAPFNQPVNFVRDKSCMLQKLSYFTRFWRGGLNFHFHTSCSNMHVAKLLVVRRYGMDGNDTQQPLMSSMTAMQTETVEISAGGQMNTVACEYNASLNVLPNQPGYETVPKMHGMLYVYLLQPLVVNATVSPSINVNVFVTVRDDFRFYGYSDLVGFNTERTVSGEDPPPPSSSAVFKTECSTIPFNTDPCPVLTNDNQLTDPPDIVAMRRLMRPITSIRDIVRRFHLVKRAVLTNPAQTYFGYVTDLFFGENALDESPFQTIAKFFSGIKGGLRIRARLVPLLPNSSLGTIGLKAYYYPPVYLTSANEFGTLPYTTPSDYSATLSPSWTPADFPGGYVGGMQYPPQMSIISSHGSYVEFELPIETIFRYHLVHNRGSLAGAATSMGVFAFIADTPPVGSYVLEIYAAYADETRLGVQTSCPDWHWTNKIEGGAVPSWLPLDFNRDISVSAQSSYFYNKTT